MLRTFATTFMRDTGEQFSFFFFSYCLHLFNIFEIITHNFNLSLKIGTAYFSIFPFMYKANQWQPTPVLLPGKSHGQRSLVGCSPWGCEESDIIERLHFHFHFTYSHLAKYTEKKHERIYIIKHKHW